MSSECGRDAHDDELPACAEGRAFPRFVCLLLSVMTVSVFVAGFFAIDRPALQQASLEAKLLVVAGLVTLLLFNYWVVNSRTRVDARAISQTWIWSKHIRWAEVTQAKLIYVPWLSWIIAPRLVLRGGAGIVMLVHASDPDVLKAFARYAMAPHLREQ